MRAVKKKIGATLLASHLHVSSLSLVSSWADNEWMHGGGMGILTFTLLETRPKKTVLPVTLREFDIKRPAAG